MQELKTEQTIEKLKDMIIDFGDGLLEFETKDVCLLLNQLELQENYNDMLVRELEDLKAENEKMKVGLFQRMETINDLDKELMEKRADIEDLEKENDNLRAENKDLHFKNDVIENICLQHQELTQWIEEEIDNEPDTRIFEVSHDFLENLYERVHKLNHEPY